MRAGQSAPVGRAGCAGVTAVTSMVSPSSGAPPAAWVVALCGAAAA